MNAFEKMESFSANAVPSERPAVNGAESLVRTLVNNGAEVCFANPGTSEMHFVSARDRVPGIRPILGLFEGAVTGAADGYGRMAGKPAATLLHLGPGLANGLANLHNARKAATPIVNIIGNHATVHQRFDAPLTSNVEAFARTVSHWVHASRNARDVAADAARAVQAARAAPGQIASLILPADTAGNVAERAYPALPVQGPAPVSHEAILQSAAAWRRGPDAFLLRGEYLRGRGLQAAARSAAATGARLVCDTFAPRIERGAGRVIVERLPYRATPAIEFLGGIETLILVGSQAPVAFFAYPGLPSELTPPGCTPLVLAQPHEDGPAALEALADLIGAKAPAIVAPYRTSELVDGDAALTNEAIMRIVGRFMPDHAIVSDESLTAGFPHYGLLDTAAPCDYLQLAGGSIGDGIPVATGAAIACPDRKVISLQGDGSAMYTLQALWTQARERLDVTTIIYANRSYAVLREELEKVGADEGAKAFSMLDLHDPSLNWAYLARGMGVEAVQVDTRRGFGAAFQSAMKGKGPFLIEAIV